LSPCFRRTRTIFFEELKGGSRIKRTYKENGKKIFLAIRLANFVPCIKCITTYLYFAIKKYCQTQNYIVYYKIIIE